MIDPTRFEKIDDGACYGTEKIRNWPSDWPEKDRPNRCGEFLSKLWANYGPPNEVGYEGFGYCFRDRDTSTVFSAYSAGTGPAFGGGFREYNPTTGFVIQDEKLRNFKDVINVFEQLLAETPPMDCEVVFDTDFGVYRVGARGGIPFEEPLENG